VQLTHSASLRQHDVTALTSIDSRERTTHTHPNI
jgi:hypothetical protein